MPTNPPSNASLMGYLSILPDPRRLASTAHPLSSLLFMAVCAVLSGADDWVTIARWAEAKEDWLLTFLDLPHGIPSHDTFARVFSLLDPDVFARAFFAWMNDASHLSDGAVIAIDGKTLRGSRGATTGRAPIHLVSAFAAANGVVLGQLKTDSKSNEITTIPALLDMLRLRGCLVTLDAMGCQKAIVAKIVEGEADYLVSVKDNQPTLRAIAEEEMEWVGREGVEVVGGSYAEEVSKRAGETIKREVWVVPAPLDLEALAPWKGLKSVVRAKRSVKKEGEERVGERWFITSLGPDKAVKIMGAIREHWAIENELHWCLDVAFQEDRQRTHAKHAAENMARLRHIALNLLKKETTAKVGIATKRHMVGWNHDYLFKVLALPS